MVTLADFTTVDSVLAILSIAIGLTIFVMQSRADDKINGIIRTQFRRQQLEKKYYGTRIISNLEQVKKNYLKLEQFLGDYLKDHSAAGKSKVKNFSSFQGRNLDDYIVPSMRSDLGRLIQFIDDTTLVDELSSCFDDLSFLFKDCSVDAVFQEPDSSIRERVDSAHKKSELIESLLLRFGREIPASVA